MSIQACKCDLDSDKGISAPTTRGIAWLKNFLDKKLLAAFCQRNVKHCEDAVKQLGFRYKRSQDTGCQVDARNGVICTCRVKAKHHETQYNTVPEHVLVYHGVKSCADIAVGDVKSIQRRRVRKIYLPEMDEKEASCDGASVKICNPDETDNYLVPKKTSSKCVGGFWQPVVNVLSEKISAAVKCIYTRTGTEMAPNQQKVDIEIGNTEPFNEGKRCAKTQVESEVKAKQGRSDRSPNTKEQRETNDKSKMSPITRIKARKEEDFSSEALAQRVHDFEHPQQQQQKHNKASLPIKNNAEKEYRQMSASTKSKGQYLIKSKSVLRRRFEALRRGRMREDFKSIAVDTVSSSPASINHKHPIKEDSIEFDPPFLEAESFYDKIPHTLPDPTKNDKDSLIQSVKERSNSKDDKEKAFEQEVSGMHKHCDKNVDEDTKAKPIISNDATKDQTYNKTIMESKAAEKKTGGMKFPFFKRRSKCKAKTEKICKTKKGVVANRCEVKPGFVFKIGTHSNVHNTLTATNKADDTDNNKDMDTEKNNKNMDTENDKDMQREAWLKKFMTNNFNSRNSVVIRWNNQTYATSSSTLFNRLVDNVYLYQQTGIVMRSRSDIQTNKNYYKSPAKRGQFLNQEIQTWMVPKTVTDMPTFIGMNISSRDKKKNAKDTEAGISNQKRSIEKAKTFPHKTKRPALHSNNEVEEKRSFFLRIPIPNDYFKESCDEENRGTSDEKVYKIVEYEALKSNSDFKKKSNFDTGDHAGNENILTVDKKDIQGESRVLETVIMKPPIHRDAMTQDSNVDFPQRCDVIGVGILTQDVLDLKHAYKFDDLSEDECRHYKPTKQCEFAQSYLQEYYRQWMPQDMFPSPSHTCSSVGNSIIPLARGGGAKSSPNVCEEYIPPMVCPSHSSCSNSRNLLDDQYRNKMLYGYVAGRPKWGKSKCCKEKRELEAEDQKKCLEKAMEVHAKKEKVEPKKSKDKLDERIRVFPKDSLEVFRRRKLYACSNKGKWFSSKFDEEDCCPDKGAPCTPEKKACIYTPKPRQCRKSVALADAVTEVFGNKSVEGIIMYKGTNCNKCRKAKKTLKLDPNCDKPSIDPGGDPGLETCHEMEKPLDVDRSPPCLPPESMLDTPSPEPEKENCEIINNASYEKNLGTPSPPDPVHREGSEYMNKGPSPPTESPSPLESPSASYHSYERNHDCMVTFDETANYETDKKCPKPWQLEPSPANLANQEQNEMKKRPYHDSSKPCSYTHPQCEMCKSPSTSFIVNYDKMQHQRDRTSKPYLPSSSSVCHLCHLPSHPDAAYEENYQKINKHQHQRSSEPYLPSHSSECHMNQISSPRHDTYQENYQKVNRHQRQRSSRPRHSNFPSDSLYQMSQIPSPHDYAYQEYYQKVNKHQHQRTSKPYLPSPPSLCQLCQLPSTHDSTFEEYHEEIKKPQRDQSSQPSPPSHSSASLCEWTCETQSPLDSARQENYHNTQNPQRHQGSQPSPPDEDSLCESHSQMALPPDAAYQENDEKPKKPTHDKSSKPESPPYESAGPSECNTSASQISDRSTKYTMNLEALSEHRPIICPMPTKMGSHYEIVVDLPQSQKKSEKKKKKSSDKKPKPPPHMPPRLLKYKIPASQFSERSMSCMMSYEGCDKPPICPKPVCVKTSCPASPAYNSPCLSLSNSVTSTLSDCVITYEGSTGYVTCRKKPPPPPPCDVPRQCSGRRSPTRICPPKPACKAWKPCPPSPPYGSPRISRSPSNCSLASACKPKPPRLKSKCSAEELPMDNRSRIHCKVEMET